MRQSFVSIGTLCVHLIIHLLVHSSEAVSHIIIIIHLTPWIAIAASTTETAIVLLLVLKIVILVAALIPMILGCCKLSILISLLFYDALHVFKVLKFHLYFFNKWFALGVPKLDLFQHLVADDCTL